MNFLPQTTIRAASGFTDRERLVNRGRDGNQPSHAVLSCSCANYFPTRWTCSERVCGGLFAYVDVQTVCERSARRRLMGDMWQCPCIRWQDTLRVSVSGSQGGWVVVEGVRSPTYGLSQKVDESEWSHLTRLTL